jgi:fructose/tagatose bisphosphate aldolase
MPYTDLVAMREGIRGILEEVPGGVRVLDPAKLQGPVTDALVRTAVFGATPELKGTARFWIKCAALETGVHLASIQELYTAMGRGEAGTFTVPAMNIRGLTYDTSRAFYRVAKKAQCGAFLFEIAKSEMGYTSQPAHEYVAVLLGAALREGFTGPLFIQGDHFQASAKSYFADGPKEVNALKALIREALDAGFYNIDIDSSTLVVLERPDLPSQQRDNARVCADLTAFIRQHQPGGVEVSVGGEIGEVGGHNSTVEEFRAFMEEYAKALPPGTHGISKISVQTGTSHGGVPLADGTIAQVKLDFGVLQSISQVGRKEFGLGGTVQHGASTLPDGAFHQFPAHGACEVHLATGFQNMVFDHPALPEAFRERVYTHLRENFAKERKADDSEEQFLYKTRKKGFGGELKRAWWDLPATVRDALGSALEEKFAFLITQLEVAHSAPIVARFVKSGAPAPSLEHEVRACGGGVAIVDDGNPRAD